MRIKPIFSLGLLGSVFLWNTVAFSASAFASALTSDLIQKTHQIHVQHTAEPLPSAPLQKKSEIQSYLPASTFFYGEFTPSPWVLTNIREVFAKKAQKQLTDCESDPANPSAKNAQDTAGKKHPAVKNPVTDPLDVTDPVNIGFINPAHASLEERQARLDAFLELVAPKVSVMVWLKPEATPQDEKETTPPAKTPPEKKRASAKAKTPAPQTAFALQALAHLDTPLAEAPLYPAFVFHLNAPEQSPDFKRFCQHLNQTAQRKLPTKTSTITDTSCDTLTLKQWHGETYALLPRHKKEASAASLNASSKGATSTQQKPEEARTPEKPLPPTAAWIHEGLLFFVPDETGLQDLIDTRHHESAGVQATLLSHPDVQAVQAKLSASNVSQPLTAGQTGLSASGQSPYQEGWLVYRAEHPEALLGPAHTNPMLALPFLKPNVFERLATIHTAMGVTFQSIQPQGNATQPPEVLLARFAVKPNHQELVQSPLEKAATAQDAKASVEKATTVNTGERLYQIVDTIYHQQFTPALPTLIPENTVVMASFGGLGYYYDFLRELLSKETQAQVDGFTQPIGLLGLDFRNDVVGLLNDDIHLVVTTQSVPVEEPGEKTIPDAKPSIKASVKPSTKPSPHAKAPAYENPLFTKTHFTVWAHQTPGYQQRWNKVLSLMNGEVLPFRQLPMTVENPQKRFAITALVDEHLLKVDEHPPDSPSPDTATAETVSPKDPRDERPDVQEPIEPATRKAPAQSRPMDKISRALAFTTVTETVLPSENKLPAAYTVFGQPDNLKATLYPTKTLAQSSSFQAIKPYLPAQTNLMFYLNPKVFLGKRLPPLPGAPNLVRGTGPLTEVESLHPAGPSSVLMYLTPIDAMGLVEGAFLLHWGEAHTPQE